MIERIPEAHRDAFERLLARDLVPETSLLADVDAHLQTILDLEERTGRGIDLRHAEALADRSRVLLRGVTGMTSEDDRRAIQAAVRYFLDASDGDRDFQPGGLVDDVQVMNAVVSSMLRTDLLIPL
ncbi:MAG: hypothetical protein EB084_19430 [Proteobacteria bacterium]|nr:hypothetical protein [Pseudomonadota bacterium]